MRFERLFHICRARLEDLQQVPVTTCEIVEYVAQLLRSRFGTEPKNPADDVVGPSLIGWIEVSRFSRRFEWSDDDPGRIRAQIQGLAVQEAGLQQGGPLAFFEVRSSERRRVPIWSGVSLGRSH